MVRIHIDVVGFIIRFSIRFCGASVQIQCHIQVVDNLHVALDDDIQTFIFEYLLNEFLHPFVLRSTSIVRYTLMHMWEHLESLGSVVILAEEGPRHHLDVCQNLKNTRKCLIRAN